MRRCATITIGDVMKKKISVCENSMVLVYILAMSGGFMDAYSYMCRGEVFANAQTGNILLMAVNLAKGNFVVALRYFAPVMAFIAGVVLAQTVHHIFKGRALHRRQIVILFEAVTLFAAAFIPYELNILCNCIISLACGAQVEAFRKISIRGAYPQSYACATTMCIGNMRTAASSICEYVAHKNRDDLRKGLLLFSINRRRCRRRSVRDSDKSVGCDDLCRVYDYGIYNYHNGRKGRRKRCRVKQAYIT